MQVRAHIVAKVAWSRCTIIKSINIYYQTIVIIIINTTTATAAAALIVNIITSNYDYNTK